jgi:hypothetical protein
VQLSSSLPCYQYSVEHGFPLKNIYVFMPNNLFYMVISICVIYFTRLSVTWAIQQQVIDKSEGIGKKAVVS